MSHDVAEAAARTAMSRWHAQSVSAGEQVRAVLLEEFPDAYAHDAYWEEGSPEQFKSFFTWGHDHEFAPGIIRRGAMGDRHIEIATECLASGFLGTDLSGQRVLDVGCWTGGDLLLLKALGADITAFEEHKISAAAAQRLCQLSGVPTKILSRSLYMDDEAWQGTFDMVYASGVIYHVTAPLLFARIAFAYIKPGGKLVLETKSYPGKHNECGYSGTAEHGWNWFAPSRTVLGRWLVDAGFDRDQITILTRANGRLLSCAIKSEKRAMPEIAGFSRPGSWLEGLV